VALGRRGHRENPIIAHKMAVLCVLCVLCGDKELRRPKPIEPDWAIIDNLRNNDNSPESLVKRVMSMSSQDRKKVGSQIEYLAVHQGDSTLAFDIAISLCRGGFKLPARTFRRVCNAVIANMYADDRLRRAAELILDQIKEGDFKSVQLPNRHLNW
jgi:hypothetical protein